MRAAWLIGLVLVLAGCDVSRGTLERQRVQFGAENPTPEHFQVCGSHGCDKRLTVSLSDKEWTEVQAAFKRRPKTAEAERRALAEALRRLEIMVGAKTGYDTDASFSTFALQNKSMDCVDEMVNTAVYLALLDEAGHLRFHEQGQRVTIGFMTRRFWTHTVASILQRDTGQEFIVETWAVKVGETPYIMDRAAWAANAPFRHD